MLLDVAEEVCFEMRFAPGHPAAEQSRHLSRPHGIQDDASTGQDRMLMRLWLSCPIRGPAGGHAVLWATSAGQPRGGIAQPATVIA